MVVSFFPSLRRGRRALFMGLVLLVFGLSSCKLQGSLNEDDLRGSIRVIDGDTFEVSGVRVRLHGIDAPENDQMCQTQQGADWACGGWITKVVTDRYTGVSARCTAIDMDRYGRTVARCMALGEDVSAWLVHEGMAFAYVKYSADYVSLEREAASVDRGLHAARLQSPADHRKARVTGRTPPDQKCTIKGNISAKGKHIYHEVGQSFYDRTGINTAKGERWFCSTAAAQAAGWRAARR
jgi:endonuclease YncB( thermonuclease family)